MKQFYVVTGVPGSGKSTFCSDLPHISIDTIFSYKLMKTNYDAIHNWLQPIYDLHESFYLDGYIFGTDPGLAKLKQVLDAVGSFQISFIFIYTTIKLYRDAYAKRPHGEFLILSKTSTEELQSRILKQTKGIFGIIKHIGFPIQFKSRSETGLVETTEADFLETFDI